MLLFHCKSKRSHFRCHKGLRIRRRISGKIKNLWNSPAGTGKTHTALALGLAACQKNYSVLFVTAAALVHELMEARDVAADRKLTS